MQLAELVQWTTPDDQGEQGGRPIEMYKVRPNNPVKGWLLSDAALAVITHWYAGRTKPCIGLENGCQYCATGVSKRKIAYVSVVVYGVKGVWLLEVTEMALKKTAALQVKDGLRGKYFVATRTGANINSQLAIKITDDPRPTFNLPYDIDIKAVLNRIWFGRLRPMQAE